MSETQMSGERLRRRRSWCWRAALLLAAGACALLLPACGKANQPQSSSSSHWLQCETIADCPAERGVVACSLEGYCVDAAGERIESQGEPAMTPGSELASIELSLDAEGRPRSSAWELAERALSRHCGECHTPSAPGTVSRANELRDVGDAEALVGAGWLVPFDAERSPLIQRLDDGSMPPPGAEPLGGPWLVELLRFLVNDSRFGVGDPACLASGVGFDEAFAAIAADLAILPAAERRFVRYVSLPGREPSSDCPLAGRALLQLLNGLSLGPSLYEPNPLAALPSLLRVDLRALGWQSPVTRAAGTEVTPFRDAWEALLAATPHAVPFEGPEADAIAADTETRVAVLPLHALVAAASDSWTYYAVLGVPASIDALYQSVGVSGGEQRVFPGARRAGTSRTILPGKHALLERRPRAAGGYLWQAFYAPPDASGASPATRPFAFTAEEAHLSFSLPNGLTAWVMAGPDGSPIAKSRFTYPSEGLDLYYDGGFDQPGGFTVESPLACDLACHQDIAVQPLTDDVRPSIELDPGRHDPTVLALLLELYPGQAELESLLVRDIGRDRLAKNAFRLPAEVSNPLASYLLDSFAPIGLMEAAELLRTTPDVVASALGIELSAELDRDGFRAQFARLLCRLNASSRNRPSDDYCAGR